MVKIWLKKDNIYNYPYNCVIGELQNEPNEKANMFVMKWKRFVPINKVKFSWTKKVMHTYQEWKLVEQECIFKIINRDNSGIYIVELYDNEETKEIGL